MDFEMLWRRLEEEKGRPDLMFEAADWCLELEEKTGLRDYGDWAYTFTWAGSHGAFPQQEYTEYSLTPYWSWSQMSGDNVLDWGLRHQLPPNLCLETPPPHPRGLLIIRSGVRYGSLRAAFMALNQAIRGNRNMFPACLEDLVRREDR